MIKKEVKNKMVNTALIVWGTFIGVFGYALGRWWLGGGYKKWLKYRAEFKKEKERLANEAEEKKDAPRIQNETKEKGQ